MKLELRSALVQLHHFQVRNEMHGDDEVTAIDLKLKLETSNEVLAAFHPRLREFLFQAEPADQGVAALYMNVLMPGLAPLHWREQMACSLVIHQALGEGEDITLEGASADGFVIEPLAGGSVALTFRVRSLCNNERVLGRLPLMLHRSGAMSLLPQRSTKRKGRAEREAAAVVETDQAPLL